jgi:hypothetical protein
MSESGRKWTMQQERLAYRRAVSLCLERFFDKSPLEAREIVVAWWQRMGKGEVFTSGLFMHDEPINTAADLAGGLRAPAIRDISERYSAVIAEAMPKARKTRKLDSSRMTHAARAA